jgi:hypothetical protein
MSNDVGVDDSVFVITLCLMAIAFYIVFVGGAHLLDEQWRLGWRR